ncbi:uncharacterized protein ankdd1b [Aplochiton taeniatus]
MMERGTVPQKVKIKKEHQKPSRLIRPEYFKGFADFIISKRGKATDTSFDYKEMLVETEKRYIEAVKKNNVVTMKALKRVVNPNVTNVHGRAPIHFAVAGKNLNAVQILLQCRVRLDQKDKYGVTPIHLAAWFGSLDSLKLLVRGGAEQKVENGEGLNIMHCAAINNHTDIVEYIVDDLQMKELDKEDRYGQRPFLLAAENGSVKMLEMLMEERYNMATVKPNTSGDTPLHLAARNGHVDTVDLLLLCFDTRNEVNTAGQTALYLAAGRGHEDCVLSLLEAGCDINILTLAKSSALHSVVERGDTSLLRILIESSALIDIQNQHLETSLHLSVKSCHSPIIHALLQAGCEVNMTNKRSQTALHLAAELARVDIVEMLLKAGVDLTLQDWQGRTALGVAARADEVIVADMILKAERYYTWKRANAELNESLHSQSPLTFKLDHRLETKSLRSIAWHLAYHFLKLHEWKRLALHWDFEAEQIQAIEEQWTGLQSYQEHGHRMLLIWLHSRELVSSNPAKELYSSLMAIGCTKAAGRLVPTIEGLGSRECSDSIRGWGRSVADNTAVFQIKSAGTP